MAKDTSLTFSLYGKDVSATGAMKKVGKESESLGKQFGKMGKAAAAGLAVAGAAAAKFAYDAVQAAADDQKSQKQLALALGNTTKATGKQIKANEDFISKMQLTYGIADDKLRPALATLARGTGSLTESQKLLGLAMDISAGTGKDLTAVSGALVKAHNGNLGALKRLGIPLSDSIIKTKNFHKATDILAKTFGGAAKTNAETFSGKVEIMKQHLNEAKEQIGTALLPTVQKFADYLQATVVPNVQAFVDGLTGVKGKGDKATKSAHDFGVKVKDIIKYLGDHKNEVKEFGIALAAIWAVGKVAAVVSSISTVVKAYQTLRTAAATAAVASAFATEGATIPGGVLAAGAVAGAMGVATIVVNWNGGGGKKKSITGSNQSDIGHGFHGGRGGAGSHYRGKRAVGGSVMGGSSYMVGENGPELFTPTSSGRITPHGLGRGSGLNVVVNVQGSVVQEKDLAVSVRDNIAILMRRQGLNPSILGV